MKVCLIEPHHVSEARGNATTARRWARRLMRRGVRVVLTPADRLADEPEAARCDVVHAHHAVHAGPAAARLAAAAELPLVVSLGGTELDASGNLDERARRSLEAADVVVGPFPEDAARLARTIRPAPEFRTVRRGVELPPRCPGVRAGRLRALVAGGLRPVKGQDLALDWQDALAARGVSLDLVFAGPVIDEAYAAAFARRLAGRGDRSWLGVVPPHRMIRAWAGVDLALNVSAREGASNAILEAWAHGRCVVARAAPGNDELLRGAPAGVAHVVEEDAEGLDGLAAFLAALTADGAGARRERAERARLHVRLHHDPEDEISELLRAYDRARSLAPPPPPSASRA